MIQCGLIIRFDRMRENYPSPCYNFPWPSGSITVSVLQSCLCSCPWRRSHCLYGNAWWYPSVLHWTHRSHLKCVLMETGAWPVAVNTKRKPFPLYIFGTFFWLLVKCALHSCLWLILDPLVVGEGRGRGWAWAMQPQSL